MRKKGHLENEVLYITNQAYDRLHQRNVTKDQKTNDISSHKQNENNL